MAEIELPEAKDPFEKGIALTIAILAVILSFVENHGAGAKTNAIIKTNQESNQWAYYQAKALKGNLAESNVTLLSVLTAADAAAAKEKLADQTKQATRYDDEKKEIKKKAEELHEEAERQLVINEHCEQGSLLLQIAVVLCSIAILVRWKPVFYTGVAVGVVGAYFGIHAYLM